MFGPWIEVFTFFKGLVPSSLRRPSLSFITLHYLYLVSVSLVASLIFYGARNIAYIDCLFFTAGAATQSGLNTVNVNELLLYQQLGLMLIACITNPIFINTFVVFVRLYWFEKRFQNVVIESQKLRRTRERSRTKTDGPQHRDPDLEERTIGHKKITVVYPGPETIDNAEKDNEKGFVGSSKDGHESSESSGSNQAKAVQRDEHDFAEEPTPAPIINRKLTFADEVKPDGQDDLDVDRLPAQRSADQHIAFLENQRNPKDKDVLYIPGPRDFDRGDLPQRVAEEEESVSLERENTAETFPSLPKDEGGVRDDSCELNEDDHPPKSRGSESTYSKPRKASAIIPILKHLPKKIVNFHDDGHDRNGPDGGEASPVGLRRRDRTRTFASFLTTRSEEREPMPYLSYQPTMGRNSMFVDLTEAQREELGGIEYRALKLLATVLSCYFIGFHVFGMLCYVPWILRSEGAKETVRGDGVHPVWWGFFTAASMFNDLGMTLTPDSMYSFYNAVFILLIGTFLIIIGNTGFPCMLRFVIWVLAKVTPTGPLYDEIRFLLDHPRRCFTLLFPTNATWWLFWVLVLLNGLDLFFFIILDLNDPAVSANSPGIRVLDGLFQAASTRTAGFSVISLSELHPAVQVSYLIMMYISVFPIAISVRRTNVYEEKSLGVYMGSTDDDDDNFKTQSYVGAHFRRQLSFDLWYVFLGLFIIAIVEGSRLGSEQNNDVAFTLFAVLFEVVSAYGTVGLSLGYPNTDPSFSSQFHVISKLIIIAMMVRGRHRGLPYALDKAILLPGEEVRRKEEEEAMRQARLQTRRTETMNENSIPAVGRAGAATMGRTGTTGDLGSASTKPLEKKATQGTFATAKTGRSGNGLTRLISQALSAGPTIPKLD